MCNGVWRASQSVDCGMLCGRAAELMFERLSLIDDRSVCASSIPGNRGIARSLLGQSFEIGSNQIAQGAIVLFLL